MRLWRIVRKDTSYRETEFARRRIIEIADTRVAIVSPEDLLLSKLVWKKASRSELQQRDVVHLVQSVPKLDWSYMERWAATLDVTKDLEEVRSS